MPHGDNSSSQLPRGHGGAEEMCVRVVGGTAGGAGVAENDDREDEGACRLRPSLRRGRGP